jgi:hypothetical protein
VADAAVSTLDVVTEEDIITLVPGWWQKVVSVLHLVTMCMTGQRAAKDQM